MQRSMQKQHFNGDANYLQQLSMLKQHSLAMHIIYGNTTCQSNTQIVMHIRDDDKVCQSRISVLMHFNYKISRT